MMVDADVKLLEDELRGAHGEDVSGAARPGLLERPPGVRDRAARVSSARP